MLAGVDLSNEAERARVVAEMAEAEKSRYAAVLAKAKALGIPVRKEGPGNRVSILHDFRGDEPLYRVTLNRNAAISSGANLLYPTPYSLNGDGIRVGVWDGGSVRSTHREITGRVTLLDSATAVDDHATHVAGTIGATGVTANAKGMAPGVRIDSYDWDDDYTEMTADGAATAVDTNRLPISNHSYGYGATNVDMGRYETECATTDGVASGLPFYLICWAAGNEQDELTSLGGYQSITFNGLSKNVLTVGAVSDAVSGTNRSVAAATMSYFSSWGPCDDGRIKPDVVANGMSVYSSVGTGDSAYDTYQGTSMATPSTAGSAALLAQLYAREFSNRWMRASLIKALLIHTADDMGTAGPDYQYGWGLINVKAAADIILAHKASLATNPKMITNSVSTAVAGQTNTFIWDGVSPVRATLCWTDPAGAAQSAPDSRTPNLRNNLDMRITAPNGTTVHMPYNMPFVGVWSQASMALAATNGDNNVDNVERIDIATSNLTAGVYTVTVSRDGSLYSSPQAYSLVITGGGDGADQPPILNSIGSKQVELGSNLVFTVVASDPVDGDAITLSATGLPSGAVFNTATNSGSITNTFTWNSASPTGTYNVTFRAVDNDGTNSEVVAISVVQPPPAAPGSIWASWTNTVAFTAAWSSVSGATGYRLDVATNSAFSGGGGGGGTLIDEDFVDFSDWTDGGTANDTTHAGALTPCRALGIGDTLTSPAVNYPTQITFYVDASAGGEGLTTTNYYSLDAGGSWLPIGAFTSTTAGATETQVLTSSPNLAGSTGVMFRFVSAYNTWYLDDVKVTGGSAGAPSYVAGYSNRTVAGTSQSVTGLTAGATYYFRARAVSGGGTSSNSATANVTTLETLSAPVFGANPGPAATTAGVAVAFTVSATGNPAPALTLQSTTASTGYNFTPGTGELTYTPPQADTGTRTFTFAASNSQGTASQTVTVNVTAATAPAFTGGAGPYSTTTGVQVAFTVSASGTPAAVLALQSTTASSGYSFTPATGAFTYTPPEADAGARTFTFTASNVAGVVTQVTSVAVAAAETIPAAPASIWASATNAAGFTAAWSTVTNAASYRLDVGTNATFTGGGGAGGQFQLASNAATAPGTLTNDWSGANLAGTTYIQMLQSASVITSAAFSTEGFTNLTVDTRARTYGGVVASNNTITVSISTNNGSAWTVVGTMVPAGSSFATMPTLTNIANLGHAQTRIRWQTLGASGSVGAGVSNLVVQGWSGGGGAPAYVAGYSNRTVAGTSQAVTGLTENTTYYFRARAVNGAGTSTNSAVASVTTATNPPSGTPPVMNTVTSQAALTGRDVERTVTATPTDGDPILSYACTTTVNEATWDFDTGTGNFLFVPTAAQIGANVFAFTATDKDGTSAAVAMTVTVSAASAPALNALTSQVTSAGSLLEYTATATEPDGDLVTFACTSTVDGATWDADTNGTFLFQPTAAQIGTNLFTFTATDRDGTSAPAVLNVRVYSAAATNDFTQWVEDEGEDPADPDFAAGADVDGDGQTTYEEYVADTDPAASNSVLMLAGSYFTAAQTSNTTGQIRFSFPASTGRYYQLEYCTGLTNHAVGTTNLGWGMPGMTVTNATTGTWYGVIRVFLQEP